MFELDFLNKQCKAFSLILCIMAVSGCAHKNLVSAGQELMTQQQYELAVDKFNAAVKEQPENQETRQKLAQAKEQLNNWASYIEQQAQLAENNQQLEKALLLYAKAFQITRSPVANSRYKALYQKLKRQSMLDVSLSSTGIDVDLDIIRSIDGLTLTQSNKATVLKFSQSNPIFEIQQSTLTLQTQYISGTQIVANPELLDLQHAVGQNQHRLRERRTKITRLSRIVNQLQNEQQRLNSKVNSLKMQLTASNLADTKRIPLEQSLSSANSSLTQANNKLQRKQNTLRDLKHDLVELRQQTNALAHKLAHLPATVEIPVYSDYQYPVQQQVNSLTSTLYLMMNNQIRPADIRVESKDQSHPEHPIIGLASNPMLVSNKEQLTPLLWQQRDKVTRRLLNELVDERKLGFYYQSEQAIGSDDKFAKLVKHGLITRKGAIKEASDKLQQMLVLEYGRGGEFDINKLLHLYGN